MNEVHAMHGMDEVDGVHGMDGVDGTYGTSVAEPVPARGKGQRVLVVVDDLAIVELLSTTLELAGYQVVTACTGTEGMKRFTEHRFDLVVLDMAVPDIDDLGHGRRFRPADRPPVLFLTAYERLSRLVPELGLG